MFQAGPEFVKKLTQIDLFGSCDFSSEESVDKIIELISSCEKLESFGYGGQFADRKIDVSCMNSITEGFGADSTLISVTDVAT